MLLARKRGFLSLLHVTSFLIRFSVSIHCFLPLALSLLKDWRSALPIQTKECHLQTVMRSFPQQNVGPIYLSKNWSTNHSSSSRSRVHFYLFHTASAAAVGSLLLQSPLFFPFPFIKSTSFLRHSATRCRYCPQWKHCLLKPFPFPLHLPLLFRT